MIAVNRNTSRVRAGFTIVELLIVIVIIAILAVIGLVAYSGIQERAQDMATLVAVRQLTDQLQVYETEHSELPRPPENERFQQTYVAHLDPETEESQRNREWFEQTYGIKIPRGTLYYYQKNETGSYTTPERTQSAYVMAVFRNNTNIPRENRSYRLEPDSNNRAWPQLIIFTSKKCPLPTARPTKNDTDNGAAYSYGAGWMQIHMNKDGTIGFLPHGGHGMGFNLPGYEDCGVIGFLGDYTMEYQAYGNSGAGLFPIKQGERL